MKLLLIPLILLSIILSAMTFNTNNKQSILIKDKEFKLHFARTIEEKEKGLSIFNSLKENEAMIFIFEKPDYYNFWMKDMKFPIDIIYIKGDKIVDVFKDVPNPKNTNEKLPIYKPKEKADKVLEINARLFDKYGFKIGDKVTINN